MSALFSELEKYHRSLTLLVSWNNIAVWERLVMFHGYAINRFHDWPDVTPGGWKTEPLRLDKALVLCVHVSERSRFHSSKEPLQLDQVPCNPLLVGFADRVISVNPTGTEGILLKDRLAAIGQVVLPK